MTLDKSPLRAALMQFGDWSEKGWPLETQATETLGTAASMLEKLLPGEDGEFSEEMRKAVYDVLDPTRDYTPQVMEAEVSAVLSAIVDTLTQAEGRDV